MSVLNIDLANVNVTRIELGMQGENGVRSVAFDISSYQEIYGSGTASLLCQRAHDTLPYPVVLTTEDSTATWLVSSSDTATSGKGLAQLIYTGSDGKIKKTRDFQTIVRESLNADATDPPDPYETWLTTLEELGAEVQQGAEDALEAAEDAEDASDNSQFYSYESEAWAVGTKNGVDVEEGDAQYANYSKFWANRANYFANQSAASALTALGHAEDAESAKDAAVSAKEDAEASDISAVNAALSAEESAEDAAICKKSSEAYAVGTRSGEPVTSDDPAYHNNSKYYKDQSASYASDSQSYASSASGYATQASASASTANGYAGQASGAAGAAASAASAASTSASTASTKAQDSEAWAVGKRNGTDVTSDDPAYHNNAKYYAQQAASPLSRILPTDSASGSIASFPDGSDLVPMQSLTVSIEPVQDLHGYDKPWSGGAGANKWDEEWEQGILTWTGINADDGSTRIRSKNFNPCVAGSEYRVVTSSNLQFFYYDSNKALVSYEPSSKADGSTITIPTGASYFRFYTYATSYGATYKNDIAINYPSSVTTYAPYSNVCPISGWDEVEAVVCGANVWDEERELGGIEPSTGQPYTATDRIRSKNFIPILADTDYYYKAGVSGQTEWQLTLGYYDANKDFISIAYVRNDVKHSPTNAKYARFMTTGGYGTTYHNDISINYPSTDHDYHAHTSTAYTTTLPSTVYGGTLDMVTGVLTVKYVKKQITSFSGVFGATTNGYAAYVILSDTTNRNTADDDACMVSNVVKFDGRPLTYAAELSYGGSNGGSTTQTFILPSTITSLAEANAWLSGLGETLEATFKLAQPTTITLTPQEIAVLAGSNNVWSDAGQTRVVYSADIQKYIDKKLQ